MSDSRQPEWIDAVARLKERLDQAEARHRLVMDELRQELEALEKQVPHEPPPFPVVKEQAPTPVPEVVKDSGDLQLPYLQKAKSEALPPSLPDPAEREPVWDFEKRAMVPPPLPPEHKLRGRPSSRSLVAFGWCGSAWCC